MPEPAKANPTHVPAKGREDDDDTDEDEAGAFVRALRKVLGFTKQVDVRTAGTWALIAFAVAWAMWTSASDWTHKQWGWGPCPHKQQIDMMYRLAAPPSQPGGAPTITLPPPREGGEK